MAGESQTIALPPVEALVGEVFASLAFAAHGYLEPADPEQPDLAAAEIAIDVAASAFARIEPRLQPDERSAMARLLADVRMTYVRKRGV